MGIIDLFLLGGHASDTKRASNLKSFVRKDQSRAIVRIHLYNGGELAYDPEKWGNEIIFEKQINENGNNPLYVRGKEMSEIFITTAYPCGAAVL